MEEKDKSQKGQQLLEVDENAKDKKKQEKKQAKKLETFIHVLLIFLSLVLLGLYLKIFIFNKDTSKHNN